MSKKEEREMCSKQIFHVLKELAQSLHQENAGHLMESP